MTVVDCTVDHGWASPEELLGYLPESWRDYVGTPNSLPGGFGARPLLSPSVWAPPTTDGADYAFPRSHAPAVCDLATLADEWLDPHGIDHALLTFGAARTLAACVNPNLALALVRAANNWTVERWLDADASDRVRGVIMVPEQMPDEAAREIRRVARHPKMAAVLIAANGLGKPAGHPAWHPIYEAAADARLPILLCSGGDAFQDTSTYPTAGGPPSTYAELKALAPQALMTHVTSLMAQGAFERFPGLQVLLAGAGFAWIPSLLWRFDNSYVATRIEAPWMNVAPSEYLVRNVRLVGQPLDGPRGAAAMERLLGCFPGLDGIVCFGSGFPGRGRATPGDFADRFPASVVGRISGGNASEVLRLG